MAKDLNRSLMEVKGLRAFKGIRMGNTLCISHLLFVDDIPIFCDGSHKDTLKLAPRVSPRRLEPDVRSLPQ
jgi:hypothetical protein